MTLTFFRKFLPYKEKNSQIYYISSICTIDLERKIYYYIYNVTVDEGNTAQLSAVTKRIIFQETEEIKLKKLSLKIIAVILVLCMVLPIIPAWAFAGDIVEDEAGTVSFTVSKVDETPSSVTVRFTLTEGKALCFDAQAQASEKLQCTAITFSEAVKNFRNENEDGFVASNITSGKFSFVSTVELTAPMDIVDVTYSKTSATGIKLSDISLTVDSCYFSGDSGEDVAAVVSITNEIPAEHTHVTSGEWVYTTVATCKNPGEKVLYCTECGEVAQREVVAQKAHTTTEIIVDATCEEDGYISEYCTTCKEEIVRIPIPKTNHQNIEDQHKDATCTEDGYDRIICKDCGSIISETVLKAPGHKTVVNKKDATCTEDGYYKETCTVCNTVIKDEITKAPGHKTVVDEKPATCTEDGYRKEICSVCNTVVKNEVLKATNHANTETQHKDATCTENGYDRVYCKDCNKVISETVLKASGHKTVIDKKDATCTEDGYYKETCSVCNTVIKNEVKPATGHQHKKTDTLAASCTTTGYIRETCADCGTLLKETILPANGHKYVNDYKAATCTENGYMRYQCSVCKYCIRETVLKAPGHSWGAWTVVKEATYRSTGLKRSVCSSCYEYKEEVIPMLSVPVTNIVIVPEKDFTLYCKKTDRLQATVFPEEAAYSADIVWSSSNSKIVSVSDDGTITAKRKGTATITAATKDGKVKATRKVTVEYTFLQWIIIYLLFGWIWYL